MAFIGTNPRYYPQRRRKTANPKNLTSIWGLGQRHAAALRDIGIRDCMSLIEANLQVISEELKLHGLSVSVAHLEQWRAHAESYCSKSPVYFGPPPPIGDEYLALDLEYTSSGRPYIWLTGLVIIKLGVAKHVWFWADDRDSEQANLIGLAKLLNAHPQLPIVTWAGTSADLPRLQDAGQRYGVLDLLSTLNERHFDLFQHARQSVRIPVPELSLGPFASYLGVPKKSMIRNGLEAQMRYEVYQGLRDQTRKAQIKAELAAYNYDDLRALIGVLGAMKVGLGQQRNDAA